MQTSKIKTKRKFETNQKITLALAIFIEHGTMAQKLDDLIMQFKSCHWLSHHGLSAIMARVRCDILGTFFIFVLVYFSQFWGPFYKTIIPLALVEYILLRY